MLDQRGRLLMAALGFTGCAMPSYDRALWALRTWLDSWPGIGRVAVGMARQGYDRRQFLRDATAAARTRPCTSPRQSPAGPMSYFVLFNWPRARYAVLYR